MASRWRSRNPGRLVEAKSFCFLLALLTLDGERGCCLLGFVRFVGSLSVLFFGGTAVVSLHPRYPRKEEVQARLEKAIGEAVKAMRLSAFQVTT